MSGQHCFIVWCGFASQIDVFQYKKRPKHFSQRGQCACYITQFALLWLTRCVFEQICVWVHVSMCVTVGWTKTRLIWFKSLGGRKLVSLSLHWNKSERERGTMGLRCECDSWQRIVGEYTVLWDIPQVAQKYSAESVKAAQINAFHRCDSITADPGSDLLHYKAVVLLLCSKGPSSTCGKFDMVFIQVR